MRRGTRHVIDRELPFIIRNPWPLALQPGPGVEIGLRHAVRSHAFAFLDLGFIGIGRPINSRKTATLVTFKTFKTHFCQFWQFVR